jgi:cytochrome c1
MGSEGGTMARRSWSQLAAIARFDATRFQLTIRDPRAVKPGAKMPGHKDYDDATLHALTEYFRTFMLPSHRVLPGKDSTP